MFKQIIDVYSENHMKHLNNCVGKLENTFNIKTGNTYSNNYAVKGYKL
jgi:hypothetical protein